MNDGDTAASAAAASSETDSPKPDMPSTPVCLVLGMAGSGKTTLVDALSAWLEDEDDIAAASASSSTDPEPEPKASDPSDGPIGAYVVNLDPAVHTLPYEPNIDIRDTIRYKDVMREYSLGPNGAIITSLNLYATRFDQVLQLVERRAPDVRAVLFDTPGQIETFTWSASGSIITEALAMVLPTVVLFIVDTQRSTSAMTFVSNMLYACSVMYKTGLPLVVVFNKVDIESCKFAQAWMDDFDTFDAALREDNFVGTLARSMALALEEFYKNMRSVGVSAVTGQGLPELSAAIKEAAKEYETDYRPALEERKRMRAEEERLRKEKQMEHLEKDLEEERDSRWAPRGVDEDDESEDEGVADEERAGNVDVSDARLKKMKGEAIDDTTDKEAYENLVKYLDALNTKDEGGGT